MDKNAPMLHVIALGFGDSREKEGSRSQGLVLESNYILPCGLNPLRSAAWPSSGNKSQASFPPPTLGYRANPRSFVQGSGKAFPLDQEAWRHPCTGP